MKSKKVLFAGSHAGSTAIAVIEEIKSRKLDWEIHWIGKRFASEGSSDETLEFKNMSRYGVKFHNLESGKVQTKFTRHTIPALFKIPFGFYKSYKLVKQINPDLVFSFGSASGVLVSICSNILKIPVIIHEQTAAAGRANIFSSYFAKKVLISRESSAIYFNKQKTELIGNPLNNNILKNVDLAKNKSVKSILITGGSRGSTRINAAIKPLLPKLLKEYFVIHQTGDNNINNFKTTNNPKDKTNSRYFSFGQTTPENMAEVMSRSDIVVSRAGANTVWELVALKKPSILIPIPWVYNDEQTENAKFMEKLGLARIIPQKELSPARLLVEIEKLVEDYSLVVEKTRNIISPDLYSSEKLVDILENYV